MFMKLPAEEYELEHDNDCDALPISNLDRIITQFNIFKILLAFTTVSSAKTSKHFDCLSPRTCSFTSYAASLHEETRASRAT